MKNKLLFKDLALATVSAGALLGNIFIQSEGLGNILSVFYVVISLISILAVFLVNASEFPESPLPNKVSITVFSVIVSLLAYSGMFVSLTLYFTASFLVFIKREMAKEQAE